MTSFKRKRTAPPLSSIDPKRTLYEILGVDRSADAGELKAAYYMLARKHHPDTGSAPSKGVSFSDITGAYAEIKDTDLRAKYEEYLNLITTPCPHCEGSGRRYKMAQRKAVQCVDCSGAGIARN